MVISRSKIKYLFTNATLQSYYPTSEMFKVPHAGKAPRIYNGLDPRKVHDYPWINMFKTRTKKETGYQHGNWSGPSIHSMTLDELVTYYNNKDYKKHFTYMQLFKAGWGQFQFLFLLVGSLVATVLPIFAFTMYLQKFEPLEVTIDPEEYYKHFYWHYYGGEIDHHAFSQYLEARRAARYRNADVNPIDWIPPEYRNKE
ncbi:hypothetical protein YYC_01988 [Plasmodium yoelii 17X]|uniref:Cytochrome c oxidase subunit ApiCOX24 n=4 Tax=Plasmodium yoelii TaxID=5861 RepID=A0AAE9WYD8_PLAYO|nr:cytochrome c oxidase subunit ApiCOX24, putative [Plasmodium yoelii]EAA18969.1 hypothetical protein [Plasmodium yoelii yoelii]ETB61045.1 hypothetical protein YYC_01988 [Plasmodium yoelii 17X]WBY58819.1 cytochrome c oxidase subunit ApiCOX24 [Plasmodium yoelii yoelii]CDU19081.1 conserved Plasmodium protein, unknown function [Plasmodium yoelii]VTZ79666.1 cytochrome c oxidase subunit ApiCOX24, putative [Plasmodium yoelii]|eukprot:XP_727404.1 cytochrome c oxidase subunit ApiCOX24, putative [Plasmodium yoelii]